VFLLIFSIHLLVFQVLAKRFKAAVVSLEHRYYGESSPFSELTSQNLTYLTSNQALFDLATFRTYYQVPDIYVIFHARYYDAVIEIS
jgi:hypothetical protein